MKRALIAATALLLGLFLVLPLAAIFAEALRKGLGAYLASFSDPAARAAFRLTITVVLIAVPLNAAFGLCASWCITRFHFPGKALLTALIDLPLAVSPVVSGLAYVLLFGLHGWLGPWLMERDLQIIFAVPGIALATVFVTFPYVARELIPIMEEQGREQEEAARLLGAGGWQILWRITLPRVKWALLNGVVLCTARAMGEFGAVSVVSGHIRGKTNTVPLHVEILYNEYNSAAAFAVASSLALIALVTLAVKTWIERKTEVPDADRAGAH
ncbi:MAG TPA: sulfate ABC transporter permease subunit CysW [Kofleriaceae bacterium]|nr:sulfate ABC transporter permease subunit CysW [Kofleriaceae bacterium]